MHLENVHRILPVYTADVSGVCSALFELGGMIVMHDPSGCNSTYNTHDETRWYDHDSLIFLSGLTELDAIMGNDRKLIEDVKDAAARLHPAFLCLCGSPVPFLNGTDLKALAAILEKETSLPSFAVETNGMHDYTEGAGKALEKVAERLVREPEQKIPHAVNILGMTPLDFGGSGTPEHLRTILEAAGFPVQSIWAMGDSLEHIRMAGMASVNLVVSKTGLRAAEVLEQRFGIPYVAGVPLEPVRESVLEALREAEKTKKSRILCSRRENQKGETAKKKAVLIGEPVTAGSLAWAISRKYQINVRVVTEIENSKRLLASGEDQVKGEEAIQKEMEDADVMIADPLYRFLAPEGILFYEFPHTAFSGRCYVREMPEFLSLLEKETFCKKTSSGNLSKGGKLWE